MTSLVGAPKVSDAAENSLEAEEHAKYAVDEHNKQNPGLDLRYKKLLKAQTQVVSGTMYLLQIEAESEKHGSQVFNAKVWTKPWESWKKLEQFSPSTDSDHAVDAVHVDDPLVVEAAGHALKGLQQRSNSLLPYELQHVVEAQKEGTNLDLVLKLRRGDREELYKAKLNRSDNGQWTVRSAHLM